MKYMLIMFLILVGWSVAATTFEVGSDKTYPTIQAAVTACDGTATGSPYTITIDGGTYAEDVDFTSTNTDQTITLQPVTDETVTISHTTTNMVYINGMDGGSVSLSYIAMRSSAAENSYLSRINDDMDTSVSFDNCTFGHVDDNPLFAFGADPMADVPTREISFTNCTFANIPYISYPMEDFVKFTMDGCTQSNTTNSGNYQMVDIRGVATEIYVTDNSITGTVPFVYGQDGATAPAISFCEFSGNTVVLTGGSATGGYSGFRIANTVDSSDCHFVINDNTITMTVTADCGMGIHVGGDGVYSGDVGYVTAFNNTVTINGSDLSHCMLIGQGTNGSDIHNNTLIGGNAGLVIKGASAIAKDNTITSPASVILKGAKHSVLTNNFIEATAGKSLALSSQTTDYGDGDVVVLCEYASVHHNIFKLSGTAISFIGSDAEVAVLGPAGHFFDSNVWFNGSSSFSEFALIDGETNPTTLAEMQTLWTTWEPVYLPNNMANASEQNPNGKTGLWIDLDGDGVKEAVGVPILTGPTSVYNTYGSSSIYGN